MSSSDLLRCDRPLLRPVDVAKRLGCNPEHARRLFRNGHLPEGVAFREPRSGRIYFDSVLFDQWLRGELPPDEREGGE